MNIFGIPIEAVVGIVICFLPIIALIVVVKRDKYVPQAYANYMNRGDDFGGIRGIHYNCPEGEKCHPILDSCHFHGKESALAYEKV